MHGVATADAADSRLPVAFLFFGGVSGAMPGSYDVALATHGFGPSSPGFLIDASLSYRLSENFFLGGQIGARGRGWLRRDGASASATGMDALAILHVRVQWGPVFDVGLIGGVGIGGVGVQLGNSTQSGAALRLSASLLFGACVTRGVRLFVRGTWDYFGLNDMDRFGHDIDLGGPAVALGFEVRS